MPYLAYTPEQYTIKYGPDRESLDLISTTVSSTQDISATNITYKESLHDLAPNTVYYFRVHSENTYGETMTGVMTLTLEPGVSAYMPCYQLLCYYGKMSLQDQVVLLLTS